MEGNGLALDLSLVLMAGFVIYALVAFAMCLFKISAGESPSPRETPDEGTRWRGRPSSGRLRGGSVVSATTTGCPAPLTPPTFTVRDMEGGRVLAFELRERSRHAHPSGPDAAA